MIPNFIVVPNIYEIVVGLIALDVMRETGCSNLDACSAVRQAMNFFTREEVTAEGTVNIAEFAIEQIRRDTR